MVKDCFWIFGTSRSGKTSRLVDQFCHWVENADLSYPKSYHNQQSFANLKSYVKSSRLRYGESGILLLAANDDNRRELVDKILYKTAGKYPIRGKTPLGFFQDEVILFWPLLVESLGLKAQFPVRLRPETEQELATKFWLSRLDREILRCVGMSEYRLVRRILDLWQLAAYSGTPCTEISGILANTLVDNSFNIDPQFVGSLLLSWRNWCLEKGLLTYSLISELYAQYLLPNSGYQQHLKNRYWAIIADDVDDYPAITKDLFDFLLNNDAVGAFSYNDHGAVRLGLGADPEYLQRLSQDEGCTIEHLMIPSRESLRLELTRPMIDLVMNNNVFASLPCSVKSIVTISRSQLLRKTTDVIIDGVKSGQVSPEEIAIIAPGLDAIARYTFLEILAKQNIDVQFLNEQLPLINSPVVRGLLTLLTLIYPGLGRLINRDDVAQMLVILSQKKTQDEDDQEFSASSIDPVRAGLIADHCFIPHPENPHLLPLKTFERWDRIGYAASKAYQDILGWIEKQKSPDQKRLLLTPVFLIYEGIQKFFCEDKHPSYQTLSVLRELLESSQHYWEIDTRLKQTDHQLISLHTPQTISQTIGEFIKLLQQGTITANPYPLRPIGNSRKAITLATIFQYRANKKQHRWHFWLDIGSPLWGQGGSATLYGANFFLRHRLGVPWTAENEELAQTHRIERIIHDLLSRVDEKLFLCHSELAVNGQEQIGLLSPLIYACEE